MSTSLGQIAVRLGCELKGDPDTPIESVATLQNAGPGSIAFLANARYRKHLSATRAAAVILDPAVADECPVAALLSKNPYATYARVAAFLHPAPSFEAGIDPTASVHLAAAVASSASIGPRAVIESGARIAEGVRIGPGCVVMQDAKIGRDSQLVAQVTICRGVSVGERALLHPGVVIGADGFGLAPDRPGWVKVPQLGSVTVGDDVEIGANTTIDRGAIDDTIIEDGVKLDNQIQIGHNVRVGAHTAIAGCTGVSGSTTIGKRCLIAGMVGIAGHIEICDDVIVTGRTFVNHSIHAPGTYSGGLPMDEAKRWRRNSARFRKLDELAKRVRRLEGGDGEEDRSAEEKDD